MCRKPGWSELADDDRALLYGAFLALALQMQGEDAAQVKLLFRRRGARAFATEAEEADAASAQGRSLRTPNKDARPKGEA